MEQYLSIALLSVDLFIVVITILGVIDSVKEHEPRPTLVMLLIFISHIALIPAILDMPGLHQYIIGYFGVIGLGVLVFLIPAKPNKDALLGSRGYIRGPRERVDERDIVFARNKLKVGTPQYDEYYESHLETKEIDDEIRIQRSKRQLGKIDGGHPDTV